MKTTIGSSLNTNTRLTTTRSRWQFLSLLALLALTFLPALQVRAAVSTSIVFQEVFGGGAGTGAPYNRDYVVLFNRGASSQSINGWSLQYSSATGTSWGSNKRNLPNATIPAGGYYLVSLATADGGIGAPLPTIDFTVSSALNISQSAGKIALCSDTVSLSAVANPTDTNIVDLVGYGATATGFETAPAPGLSATTAAQRASGGCTDTDNNSTDFTAGAPTPKNSATTAAPCGGGNAAALALLPKNTTNWPGSTATFNVTATGDATITYRWQTNLIDLANGGQVSGATSSNLTITAVDPSFATTYSVIVSNAVGSATSSVVSLTVLSNAPAIDSDPLARTGITGRAATFQVLATVPGGIIGAPANVYRWLSNSVELADVGQFSGTATPKLTISGLTADNAATYSCLASNEVGSVTSAGAALTVADTGTLAFWNFNIATNPATPEAYYGVGGALPVGITNTFFAAADDNNDPGNPTKYWGSSGYPSNPILPATNKNYGVRFNVDTTGLRNIMFTLSTRLSTSGSKYSRLQFTTDGSTFTDYPASSTYTGAGSTWDSSGSTPALAGRIFDLSGFPGVANNPSFGVRVVTETENTATYGASTTTNYVGLSAGYSANGTVSYDLVDFEASTTNANQAPTIGAISSFSIADTAGSTNITLTIADGDNSLGTLTVTATSFNTAVIANSLTPTTSTLNIPVTISANGTAPILVRVTDPSGNAAAVWFNVTVTPGNAAPTIVGLMNTNTIDIAPVAQVFSLADDGGVGSLTVSANSGNDLIVPDANVLITGSGANQTNTVTGLSGSNGIAPIRVIATDIGSPAKSTTNTYAIMVRASTNILAADSFDYDTAGSLNTNSAFMWQTHSGTAGQMDVSGGRLNLASPSNDGEDMNLPLIGAPWATNSGAVLYYSYKAKWLSLPGSVGTYVSHFMDTNSGIATGFGARVWASTNQATAADSFRIAIENGQGGTNYTGLYPLDLQTNVEYTIVARFALSNGVATLWVNPISEGGSSTNVTGTDLPNTNAVVNPINVVAYAFRQSTTDGGYGTMQVDDLRVGLTFAAVTGLAPAPTPVNLSIATNGGNAILSWTDTSGLFKLASGTNLTGITNILGTVSPVTNNMSVRETYYRLVWP